MSWSLGPLSAWKVATTVPSACSSTTALLIFGSSMMSRCTTGTAVVRVMVVVRSTASRTDSCWVWGGATSPVMMAVTMPARSRLVGLTATAGCWDSASTRMSARSAMASATRVDSA